MEVEAVSPLVLTTSRRKGRGRGRVEGKGREKKGQREVCKKFEVYGTHTKNANLWRFLWGRRGCDEGGGGVPTERWLHFFPHTLTGGNYIWRNGLHMTVNTV